MDLALDSVRDRWIRLRFRFPAFVPDRGWLQWGAGNDLARLLAEPRFCVTRLQGEAPGGSLTVTFVGWPAAQDVVRQLFFAGWPEQKQLGRIPFWRAREWTADHSADAAGADATVIAVPRLLLPFLPRRYTLILPYPIEQVLSLEGNWDDVKWRMEQNRSGVSPFQMDGHDYRISREDRDLEQFYDEMYVPGLQEGQDAPSNLVSLWEARRMLQSGWLCLVDKDGRQVAGGLCEPHGDSVRMHLIGVLGGDPNLVREGIDRAVFHAAVHWAHRQGYESMRLVGGLPWLRGVALHQRGWGGLTSLPRQAGTLLWLRLQHDTPAVRQVLKAAPYMVMDERGDLRIFIATDGPKAITGENWPDWQKKLYTPGIKGYLARSFADLVDPSAENHRNRASDEERD